MPLVRKARPIGAALALVLASAGPALAAAEGAPHLDGTTMGLAWAVPFAALLLSIAILPLAAPAFWHHHFGKVSALCAAAAALPLAAAV